MKPTLALTMVGLWLAGLPATAQTPPENHWDIDKVDVSKLPPAADQADVTFDKNVLPLFKASCVRCHGAQHPRGGLRLDTLEGTLKGGHDGKMVIPGDSKKSLLVAAIAKIDDHIAMPPKPHRRPTPPPDGTNSAPTAPGQPGGPRSGPPAKPLSTEEVGMVRAWIDQGAK